MFRDSADGIDIPRDNLDHVLDDNIVVSNLRGHEDSFCIEENGSEIKNMQSALAYEEFYEPEKLQTYFDELACFSRTISVPVESRCFGMLYVFAQSDCYS